MERIKGLHFVQLIRSEIALAERRHTEIDEGLVQRVAAESAIARTICGLVHKRRRIIRLLPYLARAHVLEHLLRGVFSTDESLVCPDVEPFAVPAAVSDTDIIQISVHGG